MLLLQNLNSFRITLCLLVILTVGSIFTQKLYAQDPIIFEYTWYLEKVYDGENDYYIADYTHYIATTLFLESEDQFFVGLCDFDWFYSSINYNYNDNPSSFSLNSIEYNPFTMDCDGAVEDPDFGVIREKMFTVFFEWPITAPDTFFNPFIFNFTQTGNEAQLVIENVNGMIAYYNSFPLSTQDLQKQGFIVYPNPVQETLYINHLNTGESYIVKVYNLNGNKMFDFALNDNQSEVNLQKLKEGMYFLVIEDEWGVKFTEKIIKR